MGAQGEAAGPDFSAGIPISDLPEGTTVSGRVGGDAVLLSRFGDELFAVSGACTHYGAALSNGLVEGEQVRCPLHHSCFDLRTGEALRAPALDALDRWKVERAGRKIFVRERFDAPRKSVTSPTDVERIVIVGGGGAGLACAHELRNLGYSGTITILSADRDAPYDRPNLSKDYLAGTAPEEWLPLRSADWYERNGVDLRLKSEVQRVDSEERRLRTVSGDEHPFDRLLIATGAEPNRLRVPGFDLENVFTLRSIADASAISARAKPGTRAAIIGSSFIGLEAAAALRQREIDVLVASPERVPLERVFGSEIGSRLKRMHESNGVRFQLGTAASAFDGRTLRLADGSSHDVDFVLVGIGVRPRVTVAESAGIESEGGVGVDVFMETRKAGIFAAGDIARYPDPLTGEPVRIEHWVVAQRQGQIAAANMLGHRRRFEAVPFFWTEQFGAALRYVGRATRWDRMEIDGDVAGGEFIARYYDGGAHRASAAIGRDREILRDELQFEQMIAAAREREPAE